MAQSELEEIMERIRAKYEVETASLRIGDRILKVLQLADFEQYVEDLLEKEEAEVKDLPFWAKIWESTFLLAYFLAKQPVVPGQRILEIGSGVGVLGIYAFLCGHNVTLSDINEDALLFARANALLNGCDRLQVRRIDWYNPELPHRYDMIVGSEVIYDRESYPALVEFLRTALAPGGTSILAKNAELPVPAFFSELTRYFKFKHTTQKVHSEGETQHIAMYAIRLKENPEGAQ